MFRERLVPFIGFICKVIVAVFTVLLAVVCITYIEEGTLAKELLYHHIALNISYYWLLIVILLTLPHYFKAGVKDALEMAKIMILQKNKTEPILEVLWNFLFGTIKVAIIFFAVSQMKKLTIIFLKLFFLPTSIYQDLVNQFDNFFYNEYIAYPLILVLVFPEIMSSILFVIIYLRKGGRRLFKRHFFNNAFPIILNFKDTGWDYIEGKSRNISIDGFGAIGSEHWLGNGNQPAVNINSKRDIRPRVSIELFPGKEILDRIGNKQKEDFIRIDARSVYCENNHLDNNIYFYGFDVTGRVAKRRNKFRCKFFNKYGLAEEKDR